MSSDSFVSSSAPPPKLPPSTMRKAAVLENTYSMVSTRFAVDAPRPLSARTATSLTTNPRQEFAPLNAGEITFSNETTSMLLLPAKRSFDMDGSQISFESFEEPFPRRWKRRRDSRRIGRESKPTFWTSRPVKNAPDVYLDVWREIFSHSSLKFLLEARTICKEFNHLLKEHQSIWRRCREREYGEDLPGPPGQLSEQAYADLIVGKGCQNRNCDKKHTSKVYWPFGVRLCGPCFKQKTVKREELRNRVVPLTFTIEGRTLLDLLPGAITKSGKYQCTRTFDHTTRDWNSTASSVLYLRRDYEALEREFLQISEDVQQSIDGDGNKSDLSAWVSVKLEAAIALTEHVHKIEKWVAAPIDESLRYQNQRALFFQDRAALLNPPMSKDVLQTMVAYQNAVEVNRPPTMRTWEGLKSKIVPLQAQAERLVELDRHMHLYVGRAPSPPVLETFRRLHWHRASGKALMATMQVEQGYVIRLARNALTKCRERGVADADLVLTCLREVHDMHADTPEGYRPIGLNADGEEGPYRLTLDDARVIVDDIIEPEVELHSQRGAVILQQFRCMACSRKDCTTRYTFRKGFEHIFEKHAKFVGRTHRYYTLFQPFPRMISDSYFRFPWYTVEWPRCLPLVPGYYDLSSEDKWDPDADIRYGLSKPGTIKSAFEGRIPYANPTILSSDFAGNLVFAAEKLKRTKLDSVCQTRIALQYALDRYSSCSAEKPSLDTFADSMRDVQASNPSVDFRFRCATCCRNDKIHRSSKYVKHAVPWHDLRKHWDTRQWHKELVELQQRDKYGNELNVVYYGGTAGGGNGAKAKANRSVDLDWTTQMMLLPDDVELWGAMVDVDEKLRAQKEAVRIREEKRGSVPRMRGDAKAAVVLAFEEAVEVFGGLFVSV